MIKTIAYNDFTQYTYNTNVTLDSINQDFKEFIENGGNLNYNVLTKNDSGPIAFEKFFSEKFKDAAAYKDLIDKHYIEDSFVWNFDASSKTISEKNGFGISWLNSTVENNEKSPKRKDFYKPYVIDSLKKLLAQVEDSGIDPEIYISADNSISSLYSPIIEIAKDLNDQDIYKVIFDAHPKYVEMFKEMERFDKHYQYLIGISNSYQIKNKGAAMVFYDYGIGNDFLNHPKNSRHIKELIEYAANKGHIDFLKNHIKDWNLPSLEKDQTPDDWILRKAHTNKEIATLLIDNGATVIKLADDGTLSQSVLFQELNIQTLEAILDYSPEYKKLLTTQSDSFYRKYIEEGKFEHIELLVTKYNFPIENYDMMKPAYRLSSSQKNEDIDYYEWVMKHGADPRQCGDFIKKMVSEREEGLKIIKALNKKGTFISYCADPISNILCEQPTKSFISFVEKANSDIFSQTTKNGLPVWWSGSNIASFNISIDRAKDLNQKDSDGQTWVNYIFDNFTKDPRQSIAPLSDILKLMGEKSQNMMIKLEVGNNNALTGNNIFHDIFYSRQHYKKETRSEWLDFVIKHTNHYVCDKINEKNHEGYTPWDYLFNPTNEARSCSGRNDSVFKIVEMLNKEIDFDATYSYEGKEIGTYYGLLKNMFGGDKLEKLEIYYTAYTMHKELPNHEPTQRRIKI